MDKISAQELRVGNYIKFPYRNDPLPVASIERIEQDGGDYEYYATNFVDNFPRHISMLSPIPLTPELLERCGFDGNPNTMKGASLEIKDHERVFKSISIYYNNDTAENQYYLFMREGAKDEPRTNDGVVLLMRNLQYLHQLQNLYYALTGIELDVKM